MWLDVVIGAILLRVNRQHLDNAPKTTAQTVAKEIISGTVRG